MSNGHNLALVVGGVDTVATNVGAMEKPFFLWLLNSIAGYYGWLTRGFAILVNSPHRIENGVVLLSATVWRQHCGVGILLGVGHDVGSMADAVNSVVCSLIMYRTVVLVPSRLAEHCLSESVSISSTGFFPEKAFRALGS